VVGAPLRQRLHFGVEHMVDAVVLGQVHGAAAGAPVLHGARRVLHGGRQQHPARQVFGQRHRRFDHLAHDEAVADEVAVLDRASILGGDADHLVDHVDVGRAAVGRGDHRAQHQPAQVVADTVQHRGVVQDAGIALVVEHVRQDVVHGAGEYLRDRMHLAARFRQRDVVVGVAQAVRAAQREAELFGDVGQKRLVVQARLGLRDDRLALVQLRQREEDRGEVAERFVQAAGLGRIVGQQPVGLEAVEFGSSE
jgi:hypothetical protein